MSVKLAVEEAIRLQSKGRKLTHVLNKVKTGLTDGDQVYVHACVLYNFEKYQDCITALFDLKTKFDFIDPQLFSFAASRLFSTQCKASLAKQILSYVHTYREYFSADNIKVIKQGLSEYKEKNIPRHLIKDIEHLFFQDIGNVEEHVDFKKLQKKIVINTYYDDSSSGIGDYLRGCCYLSTLLHKHGVEFEIDFSRHSVGKYIERSCHRIHGEVFDTEQHHKGTCVASDYIANMKRNLVYKLNEKTRKKTITIFSNYSDFISIAPEDKANFELHGYAKDYMKHRLIFSKSVKDYFKKFKIKDYDVMHFRLGDADILKQENVKLNDNNVNTKTFNVDYQSCLDKIVGTVLLNGRKNTIILSDSNGLKEYVMNNVPKEYKDFIHCLHTKSEHCSNNPGFVEGRVVNEKRKIDNMFYVALDMYIISQAKQAHSFSVYEWGSGFCYWTSKIFDVPLTLNSLV